MPPRTRKATAITTSEDGEGDMETMGHVTSEETESGDQRGEALPAPAVAEAVPLPRPAVPMLPKAPIDHSTMISKKSTKGAYAPRNTNPPPIADPAKLGPLKTIQKPSGAPPAHLPAGRPGSAGGHVKWTTPPPMMHRAPESEAPLVPHRPGSPSTLPQNGYRPTSMSPQPLQRASSPQTGAASPSARPASPGFHPVSSRPQHAVGRPSFPGGPPSHPQQQQQQQLPPQQRMMVRPTGQARPSPMPASTPHRVPQMRPPTAAGARPAPAGGPGRMVMMVRPNGQAYSTTQPVSAVRPTGPANRPPQMASKVYYDNQGRLVKGPMLSENGVPMMRRMVARPGQPGPARPPTTSKMPQQPGRPPVRGPPPPAGQVRRASPMPNPQLNRPPTGQSGSPAVPPMQRARPPMQRPPSHGSPTMTAAPGSPSMGQLNPRPVTATPRPGQAPRGASMSPSMRPMMPAKPGAVRPTAPHNMMYLGRPGEKGAHFARPMQHHGQPNAMAGPSRSVSPSVPNRAFLHPHHLPGVPVGLQTSAGPQPFSAARPKAPMKPAAKKKAVTKKGGQRETSPAIASPPPLRAITPPPRPINLEDFLFIDELHGLGIQPVDASQPQEEVDVPSGQSTDDGSDAPEGVQPVPTKPPVGTYRRSRRLSVPYAKLRNSFRKSSMGVQSMMGGPMSLDFALQEEGLLPQHVWSEQPDHFAIQHETRNKVPKTAEQNKPRVRRKSVLLPSQLSMSFKREMEETGDPTSPTLYIPPSPFFHEETGSFVEWKVDEGMLADASARKRKRSLAGDLVESELARAAALAATLAAAAVTSAEEESEEETLHSIDEGMEDKRRRNKRGKNTDNKTEEEVEVDSDAIAGRSNEETEGGSQPLSSIPPHLSPFGLTAQRRPSIVTSTMDDLSKIPLGYLWPELDGRS